jgi:hypothetical protein
MLSQLSYGPLLDSVPLAVVHDDLVAINRGKQTKWAHEDSNFGPRRYQRRALTN